MINLFKSSGMILTNPVPVLAKKRDGGAEKHSDMTHVILHKIFRDAVIAIVHATSGNGLLTLSHNY